MYCLQLSLHIMSPYYLRFVFNFLFLLKYCWFCSAFDLYHPTVITDKIQMKKNTNFKKVFKKYTAKVRWNNRQHSKKNCNCIFFFLPQVRFGHFLPSATSGCQILFGRQCFLSWLTRGAVSGRINYLCFLSFCLWSLILYHLTLLSLFFLLLAVLSLSYFPPLSTLGWDFQQPLGKL